MINLIALWNVTQLFYLLITLTLGIIPIETYDLLHYG